MTTILEAKIIINGFQLTDGQAMAIRVALSHYADVLTDKGLGDDEQGIALQAGYLKNISEINSMIFDKKNT